MSKNLIAITAELRDKLDRLPEPAGVEVYNPLSYAWQLHQRYLRRFVTQGPQTEPPFEVGGMGPSVSTQQRRVLFIGMNPGPFGMMQTGCPFGDKVSARQLGGLPGVPLSDRHTESLDLSKLTTLKARRTQGFGIKQRETSGQRFWEGMTELWPLTSIGRARVTAGGAPIVLFDEEPDRRAAMSTDPIEVMLCDCFVMNYSPLCFIDSATGKNVIPEKLSAEYQRIMGEICDPYLASVILDMGIELVFAIGRYPQRLVNKIVADLKASPTVAAQCRVDRVEYLAHPSPSSPAANAGWLDLARDALVKGGVL